MKPFHTALAGDASAAVLYLRSTNRFRVLARPTLSPCRLLVLLPILFCGCGGGAANSGPSSPPVGPAPTFTLAVTPGTISVPAGGTETASVSVASQGGFSGTVSIVVSGLPTGVVASPPSLDLVAGASGTFYFGSYINAPASQAEITFTGTSGSKVVTSATPMTVTGPGATAPGIFQVVGGEAEGAFYDEGRQLLYVTNLLLNEVDVLSGSTLVVQQRLPVPEPYGIDQMADGRTIVVGTLTQGIYTIDEDSLAVTQHLSPQFPNDYFNTTNVLPNPVALANGNVLIAAAYALGSELVEWDSTTDSFTELMSPAQKGTTFEIGDLKRSADHKWAVFNADQLYFYDSDTDSFTSSSQPLIDAQPFNIRDVAANPDGTQFAVVSAKEVTFYDRNFLKLGTVTTTLDDAFQDRNTQYSSDGKRLYWGMYTLPVVDVLDTANFVELGNVTTYFGGALTQSGSGISQSFLWVDANQRAFIAASGGVGVADCSAPIPLPPDGLGAGFGVGNPYMIGLNALTPVSYNQSVPSGSTVFVAGLQTTFQPGPGNEQTLVLIPPLSSVAGPADIVATTPDGRVYYSPQVLSYGVDILAASASLLPPTGNPYITISGFGIYNDHFSAGAVTVGGQPGSNGSVNVNAGIGNALQEIYVQIPNGKPGSADISVSSLQGSGTLAGSVSYIPSATVIPATGLVQLLYDTQRNLLYALKSTEVDVLNPATLQWQSPILPGGSGGSGYVAMTLTPDGSDLLLADSGKLTIVSPDSPSQKTDISLPDSPFGNIVATNTGKVFIGGTDVEVDLATQTATVRSDFPPGEYAGTPDGAHVVGARFTDSAGLVYVWNGATDTFLSQGFDQGFWTDVAIANDGSTFATLEGLPGSSGVIVAVFDQQLHYLGTNAYPDLVQPDATQVLGAQYTASGKTLIAPSGDSLDFFDVRTGALKGRLLTPDPLPVLVFPDVTRGNLALNPDGKTVYVISVSGLTVMQLATPIDDLISPWTQPMAGKPAGRLSAKAAIRLARAARKPHKH